MNFKFEWHYPSHWRKLHSHLKMSWILLKQNGWSKFNKYEKTNSLVWKIFKFMINTSCFWIYFIAYSSRHQAEHGLDERRFHELLGAQWEYAHRINQFAYRQYKSEYIEFLRKMLECIYGYRKKSHRTFRDKNYRVDLKNLTFELLQ